MSSVGRKVAGRLYAKLARVLTALDRTWGCSDLILCTVQRHLSHPNRHVTLSISVRQGHRLVLEGFSNVIKHVHFLGL